MTKIAFILNAGRPDANLIFAGAFGAIAADGSFEVAQDLKNIHLFNLMTPQALAAEGINLAESVHEVEITDSAAPALRATMLHALKGQWLAIYDQQNQQPGFARAALQAERAMVAAAVEKSIADIGLPMSSVNIERMFTDAHASRKYGDEDDEAQDGDVYGEGSDVIVGVYVDAVALGRNVAPGAPGWAVTSEAVDLSVLEARAETTTVANYASGRLVSSMTVFGAGEEAAAVAQALLAMPPELMNRLSILQNARVASVDWYDSPKLLPQLPSAANGQQAGDGGIVDDQDGGAESQSPAA